MTETKGQPQPPGQGDPEEPVFSGYPSGCPLSEAVLADGAVFRLTMNDPPTMEDFKSHHELGIEPRPRSTANQQCRLWALSVYLTVRDARHLKERYPHRWGKAHIAAGRLTGRMGKTLLTPSREEPTHTEWWLADGTDPLPCFKVID